MAAVPSSALAWAIAPHGLVPSARRRTTSVRGSPRLFTRRQLATKAVATTPSSTPAWSPASWRDASPTGTDPVDGSGASDADLARLRALPPLVFSGETSRLREQLARAARGEAFLLHAGDASASAAAAAGAGQGRDGSEAAAEDTFRLLVAQVIVLSYMSGLPVVKVTRQAADGDARADGVLSRYFESAAGLNLVRAVAKSSQSMMDWVDFADRMVGRSHGDFVTLIEDALAFVSACGLNVADENFREPVVFTSHHCNALAYEEMLTRREEVYEPTQGLWFASSAHMLLLDLDIPASEYTQQVAFLRGLKNPVGVFVGPDTPAATLLTAIEDINPTDEPGRVVVIVRMGAETLWRALPPLLRAVRDARREVVWVSDPMHCNMVELGDGGSVTRPFELILAEVTSFFAVHAAEGTIPAGVHLEMTGRLVRECMGGSVNVAMEELEGMGDRAQAMPRLNPSQALEMAFEVGKCLRGRRRCRLR